MKKSSQKEADIVGLITRLQEQVAALDKKVDILVSKSAPQPVAVVPSVRPLVVPSGAAPAQGQNKPNEQSRKRPLYKATCAECKKDCELPFKPTGERPVYCKACFQNRKHGGAVKSAVDLKPQYVTPVEMVVSAAVDIPQASLRDKKKSAPVKKPVVVRKPVVKKKPVVVQKKKK